jgi:hypothetical protein
MICANVSHGGAYMGSPATIGTPSRGSQRSQQSPRPRTGHSSWGARMCILWWGNERQARLETSSARNILGVRAKSYTHMPSWVSPRLFVSRRALLATHSFDVQNPSSSRAAASAEHNEMRWNVRVIASREPRAQDQGKGSQSEDRMVGHHSSRPTATFTTLPDH